MKTTPVPVDLHLKINGVTPSGMALYRLMRTNGISRQDANMIMFGVMSAHQPERMGNLIDTLETMRSKL
jgi:hypothetical protein